MSEPRPLPPQVLTMLIDLGAPPRLLAHLALVHQVAIELVKALITAWPDLTIDREAVLIGASTHDIGKIVFPEELIGPGRQHENAGPMLLAQYGFSKEHARFALTHGSWREDSSSCLEDLVVALADSVWKGRRDKQLEMKVVQHLAGMLDLEIWEVFTTLDDTLQEIANDADIRLLWQAEHAVAIPISTVSAPDP